MRKLAFLTILICVLTFSETVNPVMAGSFWIDRMNENMRKTAEVTYDKNDPLYGLGEGIRRKKEEERKQKEQKLRTYMEFLSIAKSPEEKKAVLQAFRQEFGNDPDYGNLANSFASENIGYDTNNRETTANNNLQ